MSTVTVLQTDVSQTDVSYDPRTSAQPSSGPILLATDGETTSAGLVRTTQRLAERTGAAVEVLAVLEPIPDPTVGLGIEPLPPLLVEADRELAVRANVRDLLAEAGIASWPIRLVYGTVAHTIAKAARERRASVVVMEKHHHSLLGRLFGVDTVLGTLRHAGTPVLSVPEGFEALPTRALVAVDFGAASVRAARAALALLRAPASLTLVHVTPRPVAEQRLRALHDEAYATRVADLFERLTRELDAPPGVEVRTVNLKGDGAVGQLLSFSAQIAADLIACGAHGHGPVARFFIGSIASALVREAPAGCAVLVAPAPTVAESLQIEGRLTGTTGSTDPSTWGALLDDVTRRNVQRRAQVEVDDPEFGAVAQLSGFAFLGAAYDHNDRRVDLMFGEPQGEERRHLSRTIAGVTSVDALCDRDGHELVLRIGHGRGQTLVLFDAPARTAADDTAAPPQE